MNRRKCLCPDDIANILREISENESNDVELSRSNLDSDENITLSESVDVIDNILSSIRWLVSMMDSSVLMTTAHVSGGAPASDPMVDDHRTQDTSRGIQKVISSRPGAI
ncbi:hypothetical protein TNCV_1066771 [Trichonephila clavipes]|uniref:Uncharacterized protein n=1 Tax=Trichonephila clavipes TaxID=2585209 RepID=A0A8X6UQB3_TRICX|nr:hypothetical protein TNCV_1066771 [Trichonephila clavipes]